MRQLQGNLARAQREGVASEEVDQHDLTQRRLSLAMCVATHQSLASTSSTRTFTICCAMRMPWHMRGPAPHLSHGGRSDSTPSVILHVAFATRCTR